MAKGNGKMYRQMKKDQKPNLDRIMQNLYDVSKLPKEEHTFNNDKYLFIVDAMTAKFRELVEPDAELEEMYTSMCMFLADEKISDQEKNAGYDMHMAALTGELTPLEEVKLMCFINKLTDGQDVSEYLKPVNPVPELTKLKEISENLVKLDPETDRNPEFFELVANTTEAIINKLTDNKFTDDPVVAKLSADTKEWLADPTISDKEKIEVCDLLSDIVSGKYTNDELRELQASLKV